MIAGVYLQEVFVVALRSVIRFPIGDKDVPSCSFLQVHDPGRRSMSPGLGQEQILSMGRRA
jgi:hypothetical protein